MGLGLDEKRELQVKVEASILLLLYNREKVTRGLIERLKSIGSFRKIYVAVDGPKNSVEDALKVEAVKSAVRDIDFCDDVKLLFRSSNLGCKFGVSQAIDWFFSFEDEGIILEDDCYPSLQFFQFTRGFLKSTGMIRGLPKFLVLILLVAIIVKVSIFFRTLVIFGVGQVGEEHGNITMLT